MVAGTTSDTPLISEPEPSRRAVAGNTTVPSCLALVRPGNRGSSRESGHEEFERLAPAVAVVVARLCSLQPWTYWPATAQSRGREQRASGGRLVAARAHRRGSPRAGDSAHAKVCDVQGPSRRAADSQVLAPAALIRPLAHPREIGRLYRWSDEIDLHRAAEPVQPAGDTLRQPEVPDPLTGNPHNLRRSPARRFRAGRVAATGADKAACEHNQVGPRIGCGGRDRPRLQPVLGGMLGGRDDERRLDGSVIESARRAGPERDELRQR